MNLRSALKEGRSSRRPFWIYTPPVWKPPLPGGNSIVVRLRYADTGLRFYRGYIRCIDRAAHGDVFAAIRGGNGDAGLRFDLTDIGSVHVTVFVRVAEEKAHENAERVGVMELRVV